jgi:hypothetical protein
LIERLARARGATPWHALGVRGRTFVIALGVGLLLVPSRVDACSFGPHPTHEIDPAEQAADTTPPSEIGETTYSVQRGQGPQGGGCSGESVTSCDDIGSVSLQLGTVSDDRTGSSEMGFRLEVVDGALPSGLELPSGDVRAYPDGALTFHWTDGASDDQEAFDFTLSISAVDRGGNGGPPREVRVQDDGSSEGCAVKGSGVDLSWLLVALALFLAGQGRRLPHTARRPRAVERRTGAGGRARM